MAVSLEIMHQVASTERTAKNQVIVLKRENRQMRSPASLPRGRWVMESFSPLQSGLDRSWPEFVPATHLSTVAKVQTRTLPILVSICAHGKLARVSYLSRTRPSLCWGACIVFTIAFLGPDTSRLFDMVTGSPIQQVEKQPPAEESLS